MMMRRRRRRRCRGHVWSSSRSHTGAWRYWTSTSGNSWELNPVCSNILILPSTVLDLWRHQTVWGFNDFSEQIFMYVALVYLATNTLYRKNTRFSISLCCMPLSVHREKHIQHFDVCWINGSCMIVLLSSNYSNREVHIIWLECLFLKFKLMKPQGSHNAIEMSLFCEIT